MSITEDIVIHWFRQDLRLSDNPSLLAASQNRKVLPIYILDDINSGQQKMGAASRVWLYHSLKALKESLNGNLSIFYGDPLAILLKLCDHHNINRVFWNKCHEPWAEQRDQHIKLELQKKSIIIHEFHDALLWNPEHIKHSGTSRYKVFSHFYKKGCLKSEAPRMSVSSGNTTVTYSKSDLCLGIDHLNLLPKQSWHHSVMTDWQAGEQAAKKRVDMFFEGSIHTYKDGRNFPSKGLVSRLSPHIHFGELSVANLWYRVAKLSQSKHTSHFCSELAWREFSYYLLTHNPKLQTQNLQRKFDHFPWRYHQKKLETWQKGLTGIPMVDAGMRELWQTGYMHNRVRMITASFLVKHLLIDWRYGEQWFWDCLFDADLANNSASWQWVAGCGADAATYFRIFNPVLQAKKFDPDGDYIKRYVPELKRLFPPYLFSPWEAPKSLLIEAEIELGNTYPYPIVDLQKSAQEAQRAFDILG